MKVVASARKKDDRAELEQEFLAGGTMGAFLVRAARYAVIIFVIIGIYPKVFPLFEKIGKKK